jgi:ribosome-associated heat shock protein Hsp15
VLTLPLRRDVLVIELLALPVRRGPASEARACYRPLDAGGAKRIAGGEAPGAQTPGEAEGKAQQ